VFVWIFHRITGVLLIFLLGLQLFTGFYQASTSGESSVAVIADLHRHAALNCVMVFCAMFHASYGIRTILMDLGVRREKLLFWVCTLVAATLYVVFLVLFFELVAR